ncbi:MAG: hypothetical protein R2795_24265 [Saprospiraceae bacterium]
MGKAAYQLQIVGAGIETPFGSHYASVDVVSTLSAISTLLA